MKFFIHKIHKGWIKKIMKVLPGKKTIINIQEKFNQE